MSEQSTKDKLMDSLNLTIEGEIYISEAGRKAQSVTPVISITVEPADPDVIDRIKSAVLSSTYSAARKRHELVLVPAEPTHEMCLAGNAHVPSDVNSDAVYRAMIQRWLGAK